MPGKPSIIFSEIRRGGSGRQPGSILNQSYVPAPQPRRSIFLDYHTNISIFRLGLLSLKIS
jgi:hypothetical protein